MITRHFACEWNVSRKRVVLIESKGSFVLRRPLPEDIRYQDAPARPGLHIKSLEARSQLQVGLGMALEFDRCGSSCILIYTDVSRTDTGAT
jgi:hypothetical protein